jgi:transcriptional regulator with XRE-family HTH domain
MADTSGQNRGLPLPRLKAWRVRKLMTQVQLAHDAGVAIATLVRAERGDVTVSFATIRRIAAGLGISTDDLLYHDPDGS